MELKVIVVVSVLLTGMSLLWATSTYKSNVISMEMIIMIKESKTDSDTNCYCNHSGKRVQTSISNIQSTLQKIVSNKGEIVNRHRSALHATDTLFQAPSTPTYFDVLIDLQHAISTIGPKFVGVTIDSDIFRHLWKRLDVYSKRLQSLAKCLAPSWVRVGGTAADFFIFDPSTNDVSMELPGTVLTNQQYGGNPYPSNVDTPVRPIKNYTVTGEEWVRLNYLVQTAGWDLIFDFNEFLRKDGHWDPDNARKLLTFSQGRNYSIPVFQIGNEPNSYYHNFQFKISASKLARDMRKLRELLSEFPAYRNSSIVGPDVTKVTKKSSRKYLERFLQAGGQNVVSAVTMHHYYFSANVKNASLNDFINTTILDTLTDELSIGTSISHSFAPDLPVWLSETSSVSGGGLKGVSSGYAAGFMWLDKLGLSALYGLKAVLRQGFIKNNYALISEDFTPYPDYFLTVLYKRLVKGTVFKVTTSTDKVRVYASCANPTLYPRGALTLYALNVQDKSITLNISQFFNLMHETYILTPGDHDGLMSAFVALNGVKLEMVDTKLPPLPPLTQQGPVTFPAYSFGFVVIPQAQVKLCNTL